MVEADKWKKIEIFISQSWTSNDDKNEWLAIIDEKIETGVIKEQLFKT
jgi:hypothetical protein